MIHRFKSIRRLSHLELHPLNVLIGANGAGKSNFVSFFTFMAELINRRLQSHTAELGGAKRILSSDCRPSDCFASIVRFPAGSIIFIAAQTEDDRLQLVYEEFIDSTQKTSRELDELAEKHRNNVGTKESQLRRLDRPDAPISPAEEAALRAVSRWKVYHFHDSSPNAGVKRSCSMTDCEELHPDASNLAAFLYQLRRNHPGEYEFITDTVRLVVPYFEDFVLIPRGIAGSDESQINLQWQQKGCPTLFGPNQFSDGTIRFICLTAALLQPDPPATMLFDEPELGLHPSAVEILASMIHSVSTKTQLIVSTQSPTLLNKFQPEDILVVEQEKGNSAFRHISRQELGSWLDQYSLGQLWEKNVLGGRPR